MNQIIRDHFRRWWPCWLGLGLAQLLLTQVFSHFFLFITVLSMGFHPVAQDRKNGSSRVLQLLPLARLEQARALWWLVVGLPCVISLGCIELGSALIQLNPLYQRLPFQSAWTLSYGWSLWLKNALLLALFFPLLLLLVPARQEGRTQRPLSYVLAAFYAVMVFCPYFLWHEEFTAMLQDPLGGLAVLAAVLALSWFGFVPAVAGAARFTRLRSGPRPLPHRVLHSPAGIGGLQYLFARIVQRGVLCSLLVLAIPAGLVTLFSHPADYGVSNRLGLFLNRFHTQTGTAIYLELIAPILWLVIVSVLVSSLRVLRTLPLSTSRLASLLVTVSCVALGSLLAIPFFCCWSQGWTSEALAILCAFLFGLTGALLTLPLLIQLQAQAWVCTILLFVLWVGPAFAVFHLPALGWKTQLAWGVPVLAISFWLSCRGMRVVLAKTRSPYRSGVKALFVMHGD